MCTKLHNFEGPEKEKCMRVMGVNQMTSVSVLNNR
jgi:hypothetical protein